MSLLGIIVETQDSPQLELKNNKVFLSYHEKGEFITKYNKLHTSVWDKPIYDGSYLPFTHHLTFKSCSLTNSGFKCITTEGKEYLINKKGIKSGYTGYDEFGNHEGYCVLL